jgi:hypothetical protein
MCIVSGLPKNGMRRQRNLGHVKNSDTLRVHKTDESRIGKLRRRKRITGLKDNLLLLRGPLTR